MGSLWGSIPDKGDEAPIENGKTTVRDSANIVLGSKPFVMLGVNGWKRVPEETIEVGSEDKFNGG